MRVGEPVAAAAAPVWRIPPCQETRPACVARQLRVFAVLIITRGVGNKQKMRSTRYHRMQVACAGMG